MASAYSQGAQRHEESEIKLSMENLICGIISLETLPNQVAYFLKLQKDATSMTRTSPVMSGTRLFLLIEAFHP